MVRIVTSKLKILTGIAVVAVTISGCTSTPEHLADMQPARTAKTEHLDQLSQWIFPSEDIEKVRDAFNKRCVAERGGKYIPHNERMTLDRVLGTGLTLEEAQKHGYDSVRQLAPTVAIDAKSQAAFFGGTDKDKGTVEAKLLDYSSGKVAADGCMAEGLQYIYGSVENGLKAAIIAPSFAQSIRDELLADKDYIDLQKKWSECMANIGYENYPNTTYAEHSVDPNQPEATQELAVGDAQCREDVNFDGRTKEIANRYFETVYTRVKNVGKELEKIHETAQRNLEADHKEPKNSSPVTAIPSPSSTSSRESSSVPASPTGS